MPQSTPAQALRTKLNLAIENDRLSDIDSLLKNSSQEVLEEAIIFSIRIAGDDSDKLDDQPLVTAVKFGRDTILAKLLKRLRTDDVMNIPDLVMEAISNALLVAAEEGQVNATNTILELPVVQAQKLSERETGYKINFCGALKRAAYRGRATIVNKLLERDDLAAKVLSSDVIQLEYVAQSGSLDVLERVLRFKTVAARFEGRDGIESFRLAMRKEYYHITDRLYKLPGGPMMLKAAFVSAAKTGEKFLMARYMRYPIIKEETTNYQSTMLIDAMHEAMLSSYSSGIHCAKYILDLDYGLEYYFAALKKENTNYSNNFPDEAFDFLDQSNAEFAITVLEKLIKKYRGNSAPNLLLRRITQLLTIPAVRELAAENDNYLLDIAKYGEQGQPIIDLLQGIPEVKAKQYELEKKHKEKIRIKEMLIEKLEPADYEKLRKILWCNLTNDIVIFPVTVTIDRKPASTSNIRQYEGRTYDEHTMLRRLHEDNKKDPATGIDLVGFNSNTRFALPNKVIARLYEYIENSTAPVNISRFPEFANVDLSDVYNDVMVRELISAFCSKPAQQASTTKWLYECAVSGVGGFFSLFGTTDNAAGNDAAPRPADRYTAG